MNVDRATIPEIVFVTYDMVIKDYRPFILKTIAESDQLMLAYKEFIDTALVETLTDKQKNFLPVISRSRNIFEHIAIKKFNYDKSLKEFISMYPNIYSDSELLTFGESIHVLKRQKFTSKIFIYTEEYDERIHYDIQSTYTDMGLIEYVSGPFEDVIMSINENITTYVLNDADLVDKLIALDRVKETEILIADIAYNYKINDKNELMVKIDNLDDKMNKHIFRIGMFKTVTNIEPIPTDIMDDSYHG